MFLVYDMSTILTLLCIIVKATPNKESNKRMDNVL